VDLARREPGGFTVSTSKGPLNAAQVILTTGGQSYPGSGTTGDGYRFVAALGHSLVPPRPALTPITVDAAWVRELTGLTAPDVALEVVPPREGGGAAAGRPLAAARGSLLFTHFGLSGPVALDVSRAVSGCADPRSLRLRCDFLPGTPPAELERFALPDGPARSGKTLGGLTSLLLPRRLAEAILGAAGLPSQRKIAELSKADRATWIATLKGCLIPVTGTRGFGKAEVTAGGVPLDEVDSRTMQSKLVPGLFLAGEILDLDGPIGGYNFQAAFSTGWLAGESVA
jgi:predicted Rossmann fold flavoprotein